MSDTAEILRQRLRAKIEDRRTTARSLSLAIGANPSYVSQLLDGRGGMPSAARLQALAEQLETSSDYLVGASASPDPVASEVSLSDRHLEWNGPTPGEPGIPIVGTGDCADLEVNDESGHMVSVERASFDPDYHVRYIARPPALRGARDLYAVYFHGQSMEPRYEAGEIGIVDPRRHAKAGDYVLVQLNSGESDDVVSVLVKRLVRQSSTELVLEQFNPQMIFSVPRSRVARVHRILQQTDLLFG